LECIRNLISLSQAKYDNLDKGKGVMSPPFIHNEELFLEFVDLIEVSATISCEFTTVVGRSCDDFQVEEGGSLGSSSGVSAV